MRCETKKQDRKRVGNIGQQTEKQEQEIKKQNEEKKEYLSGYQKYKKKAERLREQMEELCIGKLYPSLKLSGLPTARCQKDLSDYIVRRDELAAGIIEARKIAIEKFSRVQERIEEMEDENEKMVLTLRYLRDYSWEKINKEMSYSYQHIHRIHAKALKNFKLN